MNVNFNVEKRGGKEKNKGKYGKKGKTNFKIQRNFNASITLEIRFKFLFFDVKIRR